MFRSLGLPPWEIDCYGTFPMAEQCGRFYADSVLVFVIRDDQGYSVKEKFFFNRKGDCGNACCQQPLQTEFLTLQKALPTFTINHNSAGTVATSLTRLPAALVDKRGAYDAMVRHKATELGLGLASLCLPVLCQQEVFGWLVSEQHENALTWQIMKIIHIKGCKIQLNW